MKKKTLFTSFLTIVMCLCLTVGATFALFTSSSEVDISVTSGNVNVKATASELDTDIYSGSVTKIGNEITVERLVPGDSFSFDIEVENYSDVAVQYRTVLSSTDGGLFTALKVTITDGAEKRVYNGGYVYEDWAMLSAGDADATTAEHVKTLNVLVEFPDTGVPQNEYQGKSCTMNVLVEAVQGNASVVNPVTKVSDRHYQINDAKGLMLMKGIASGMNTGEGVGCTFELTDNIDMTGYAWSPIEQMWIDFEGNGYTISNLNCGTDSWGRSGFFGYLGGGSVKNLTLENVTAEGTQVGVIAGALEGRVENVTIKGNNSVKYNRSINTQETWGGVGAVTGVAQLIPTGVVIDGNVTVDYNGLITLSPYGSVNALINNIDSGVTTNGSVTVTGKYVYYVDEGFGIDKDGNYLVLSKEGLINFANMVNGGNTFSGKTVKLDADIDLENELWTPIGTNADSKYKFYGVFDGQNKTIYNLKVEQSVGYHAAGLFGALNGTIKNLNVVGAEISNISSGDPTDNGTGVIAGSIYTKGAIDNVHVKKATVNGNRYVGGISGYTYGSVTNCSVEDIEITADFDDLTGEWNNADKVGGIAGYFASESVYVVKGNSVKNATIKGYRDVGGVVGYGLTAITNNTVENATIILDDTHNYKNYTNNDQFDLGLIVGEGSVDASNVAINSTCVLGNTTVVSDAESLQEAILGGSTEIVLGGDVNLNQSIVFGAGSNVTIDTAGYTISRSGLSMFSTEEEDEHTIINEGTLTICGNGTINSNKLGGYAIYNAGNLVINGSDITGVVYTEKELVINGGTFNAAQGEAYVLRNNKGNMVVNGGVVNGGSSYPIYSYNEGSKLVINDVTVNASFGCVNTYGSGSSAEINGGTFNMTGVQGTTSHIAYFSASNVAINGGSFNKIGDVNMSATGGGGICAIYGANLSIKGGFFSGDYADVYNWGGTNSATGDATSITVTGGTFSFNTVNAFIPSDSYFGTVESGDNFVVTVKPEIAKKIADTLASNGTVELKGDYAPVATAGGYSQAGLVQKGGVIDGQGHTISATNSDGTWDCTIYTNGGTIKNATVSGGFRGIFTAGLNQDLYIQNVIFKDVVYTFSADDGNVNYGVYFTGCTVNGWTSFANKFKEVVFTDSTFGEGSGYAYCRPYNETKFVNCHFEEGYAIDGSKNALHFENCTFGADKTPLTIENYTQLIGGLAVGSINGDYIASSNANIDAVINKGATTIYLKEGTYVIPNSAQGKNVKFVGVGDVKIATNNDTGSYEGCNYALDGATAEFVNVTINTPSTTYIGYARAKVTFTDCTFNGTYTLYDDSVFNNCVFNVSGDVYNIWTWGAPKATFNNCTFNSDGKAILLYGGVDTVLTVNGCTFNDNGGLEDKKAAIEIGNDYGVSYVVNVTNTTVNGYEINDKGINTNTTLWGNKNSMGTDKLNVVVDGVDVY